NVGNLTPGLGIPARRDIDAFSGARQAPRVRAVEVRDVNLHRAVVTDRRAEGELAARRDGWRGRRRVEVRAADQAAIRRAHDDVRHAALVADVGDIAPVG